MDQGWYVWDSDLEGWIAGPFDIPGPALMRRDEILNREPCRRVWVLYTDGANTCNDAAESTASCPSGRMRSL